MKRYLRSTNVVVFIFLMSTLPRQHDLKSVFFSSFSFSTHSTERIHSAIMLMMTKADFFIRKRENESLLGYGFEDDDLYDNLWIIRKANF